MNPETNHHRTRRLAVGLGFIVASLLFAALVVGGEIFRIRFRRLTPTAPPCAPRTLAEIRAAEVECAEHCRLD